MHLPEFRPSYPPDDAEADAAAFGVDEVVYLDLPEWYLRLYARFRMTWRRELAFMAGLLVAGAALGLVVGILPGSTTRP